MAAILSTPILVFVLFVLNAVASPGAMAASTDLTPTDLDNAEDNVCGAHARLKGSREALNNPATVSIEELAGHSIEDARRRQALQNKLDESIANTKRNLVEMYTKELAKYQAQYRRMTGAELNVAYCGDNQRRARRREAWEKQRQEAVMQRQADKIAASEESMLRGACREKQILDGPPPGAGQAFRAEDIKAWKAQAQVNYDRLVAAYANAHGKRFDPTRCK